jgi:hypothetical protein
MISIKNIRATLASLISPPSIATTQLVSPPAPSAIGGPGELIRANPRDLDSLIRAVSAVSSAMKAGRPVAAIPGRGQPAPARLAARAAAPAPSLDAEGTPIATPPTDSLQQVVKQLETSIETLKKMLPADADTADADEETAKGGVAARSGNWQLASDSYNAAIACLGAKIKGRTASTALRAEPTSRSRAHRLTASGFSGMPSVAALNSALGRGGALSIVDRSGMVVQAPVSGHRKPAPAAVATTTDERPDVVKINSIRAELASLDKDQRKLGFSNEKNARHATLSRELKSELRKFHVR